MLRSLEPISWQLLQILSREFLVWAKLKLNSSIYALRSQYLLIHLWDNAAIRTQWLCFLSVYARRKLFTSSGV